MMTVLYILLAVILLVVLLLLLDISLVFSYKEKFEFKVKILFISLSGSKILDIVESKEDNRELKDKKPQEIAEERPKKKKTPSDIIDLVTYIVGIIKAVLGEFARYARLKICTVKVSIGSEDCAHTALLYGVVSSALYTVLEFLDSLITVKKNYKKIGIAPDFTSEECRVEMKIILRFKILHLLLAFIHILPSLARAKKGR